MSLKNIVPMPDLEELRKALHYDPSTGFFYCKKSGKQIDRRSPGADRAKVYFLKKQYQASRLAWFYVHGETPITIDHINEVKDDNRISNLRSVTHQENIRAHWERVRNASVLMRPTTVERARDAA